MLLDPPMNGHAGGGPVERAGSQAAHAAVRPKRIARPRPSPACLCRLDRHGYRLVQMQTIGDRPSHFAERGLAAFHEGEHAARRPVESEEIEVDHIRDVDGRPSVETAADVGGIPCFSCQIDEERELSGPRGRTQRIAVDQAVAENDGADTDLREDGMVERHAGSFVDSRCRKMILVIYGVARFAIGVIHDDAAATGVQQSLARTGQSPQQRVDRRPIVAARRIHDRIGGARLPRQQIMVGEGSVNRNDPERFARPCFLIERTNP